MKKKRRKKKAERPHAILYTAHRLQVAIKLMLFFVVTAAGAVAPKAGLQNFNLIATIY